MKAILVAMAKTIDPEFSAAQTKHKETKTSGYMYSETTIRYGDAQQGVEYKSYVSEPESYYDPGSITITLGLYGLEHHRLEITYNSNGRNTPSYTFKVEGEEQIAQTHVEIFQRVHTLLTERGKSNDRSIATDELLHLISDEVK